MQSVYDFITLSIYLSIQIIPVQAHNQYSLPIMGQAWPKAMPEVSELEFHGHLKVKQLSHSGSSDHDV